MTSIIVGALPLWGTFPTCPGFAGWVARWKRAPRIAALAVVAWLASVAVSLAQPGEPIKIPSWQPPGAAPMRAQVFGWLDQQKADAAVRAKAEALWPANSPQFSGTELLERVVQIVAVVDPNAQKLVELCSRARASLAIPSQPWLADPKRPAWIAKNFRLWYGRWLAQQRLFDEALEQLDGIQPEEVVDPATLLFYQAIVYHRLLNRDAAMDTVAHLLDAPEQCPRRYIAVARLIESDLKDMKEESLDHIARRMEDIERRLDLGRAGPKVRKQQDGVIKSLDKLIEELEAMQQQQQASTSGENMQPNNPAQKSIPAGGKGPGKVAKRDIGKQSGWGNLPPKQRDEALQQIGRDFPAHYREVIEQYFRKLATEGSK
jgi:hypothetical protein